MPVRCIVEKLLNGQKPIIWAAVLGCNGRQQVARRSALSANKAEPLPAFEKLILSLHSASFFKRDNMGCLECFQSFLCFLCRANFTQAMVLAPLKFNPLSLGRRCRSRFLLRCCLRGLLCCCSGCLRVLAGLLLGCLRGPLRPFLLRLGITCPGARSEIIGSVYVVLTNAHSKWWPWAPAHHNVATGVFADAARVRYWLRNAATVWNANKVRIPRASVSNVHPAAPGARFLFRPVIATIDAHVFIDHPPLLFARRAPLRVALSAKAWHTNATTSTHALIGVRYTAGHFKNKVFNKSHIILKEKNRLQRAKLSNLSNQSFRNISVALRDVAFGRRAISKFLATCAALIRLFARVRANMDLHRTRVYRRVCAVRTLVRSHTRVRADVNLQGTRCCRCMGAVRTLVRPFARVRADVLQQIVSLCRHIQTMSTRKQPLARVRPDVVLQSAGSFCCKGTVRARIWPLARMRTHVFLQVSCCRCRVRTVWTWVWPLARVRADVARQSTVGFSCKRAVRAAERPRVVVGAHVLDQRRAC